MKKFVVIAFAATVSAALISPSGPLGGFWPPAADLPVATGGVRAGFIAEGMVEYLACGIGIALLVTGPRRWRSRTESEFRARTAWLASAWLFASWMPHAALHRHIGMRPADMLPVEWVFHGGAIVALAALLWAVAPHLVSGVTVNPPGDPDARPTRARGWT